MRVSELTGHALNWAVAMAEGDKVFRPKLGRPDDWDKEAYCERGEDDRWVVRVENPNLAWFVDWTYNPSASWMQGGPIIGRERINLWNEGYEWEASLYGKHIVWGETALIAAMRCYVASKLGDEVEIPAELLTKENCNE